MDKTEIIALIKKLTGQSNILTIPRAFVRYTGSVDCALFLSQVLHWSDKGQNGWFYKKYEEWEAEIGLSEYQIRKAANALKTMGILETKLKKANGAPTVHYFLKEPAFSDSIVEFLKNEIRANSGNLDSPESEDSTNRDYQRLHTKGVDDSQSPPFCGEEFLAAFADFEQHRKEHKRAVKATERKSLYKKLARMGEVATTAALRQSVEAGWFRVFEPSQATSTNGNGFAATGTERVPTIRETLEREGVELD
jgi:hypothetical protein